MSEKPAILSLSGGSDNGAYGAGLMKGWTARGDRPEFHIVTGISTGALSAPFVFLGPEYDEELQQIYGGFPPSKIFEVRSVFSIRSNVSVADSRPLADRIAQYLNDEMMAEIAREHRRGRRLVVQTTHLDAQRPVVWDIGALAVSGAPNAVDVARKALLASASIPVVFPPVVFEVEIDGEVRDEMHGDGGVISQSTVLAEWQASFADQGGGAPSAGDVYIVRNGRITPEPEQLNYRIMALAGRSISTLIKAGGLNDMQITYDATQIRGGDYHATWIGDDFNAPHSAPFDQNYMKALFTYGYDKMLAGEAWSNTPPLLNLYQ